MNIVIVWIFRGTNNQAIKLAHSNLYLLGKNPMIINTNMPKHRLDITVYFDLLSCFLFSVLIALISITGNMNPNIIPISFIKKTIIYFPPANHIKRNLFMPLLLLEHYT